MAKSSSIPNTLPNIKYSPPSVRKDAYTNPQYIRDESYSIWNKGMQEAIQGGLLKWERGVEAGKIQAEGQKRLNKEALNERLGHLEEVRGLVDTGSTAFDTNKMDFFYYMKDEYLRIKKEIEKNPQNRELGAKAMAKLEGLMQQYKAAAPLLIKQIALLNQDLLIETGLTGAIWSQTDTDMQIMMRSIAGKGKANVGLVDNDGKLFLYMEPQYWGDCKEITDKSIEKGCATRGAQMDMGAFLNMEANGVSLFDTMPDVDKEMGEIAKNFLNDAKGNLNPAYWENEIIPTGQKTEIMLKKWRSGMVGQDGQPMVGEDMIVINGYPALKDGFENPWAGQTLTGREHAMIGMIEAGSFNSLMGDEKTNDMAMIWNDKMGKLDTWDPTDPVKIKEAALWLADQAVRTIDKGQDFISQGNEYLKSTGTTPTGTEGERTKKKLYNTISSAYKNAFEFYAQGDSEKAAKEIEKLNNLKGYEVKLGRWDDENGAVIETGNDYEYVVLSKPTSTGKQTKLAEFNIRQPGSRNNLLQGFGLIGSDNLETEGGDYQRLSGKQRANIDWAPLATNFDKAFDAYKWGKNPEKINFIDIPEGGLKKKDAIEGGFYKNTKTGKRYQYKDGKYVNVNKDELEGTERKDQEGVVAMLKTLRIPINKSGETLTLPEILGTLEIEGNITEDDAWWNPGFRENKIILPGWRDEKEKEEFTINIKKEGWENKLKKAIRNLLDNVYFKDELPIKK